MRAGGREGVGLAAASSRDTWADSDRVDSPPSNTTALQRYVQKYQYDKAGNMLRFSHSAAIGSFSRSFNIDNISNQLLRTTVGSDTYHTLTA